MTSVSSNSLAYGNSSLTLVLKCIALADGFHGSMEAGRAERNSWILFRFSSNQSQKDFFKNVQIVQEG